jgi:hypothetical protein
MASIASVVGVAIGRSTTRGSDGNQSTVRGGEGGQSSPRVKYGGWSSLGGYGVRCAIIKDGG